MSKAYENMSAGYRKVTEFIQKIVILILVFLVLLIVWFSFKPFYLLDQISIGMNSEQVISVLGNPTSLRIGNDGSLCRANISPNMGNVCKQLINSGAAESLFWNVAIDSWLVVGFDKKNEVCFKLHFEM